MLVVAWEYLAKPERVEEFKRERAPTWQALSERRRRLYDRES
jgi:hypothetical protein